LDIWESWIHFHGSRVLKPVDGLAGAAECIELRMELRRSPEVEKCFGEQLFTLQV
jgi:hypothetical protein